MKWTYGAERGRSWLPDATHDPCTDPWSFDKDSFCQRLVERWPRNSFASSGNSSYTPRQNAWTVTVRACAWWTYREVSEWISSRTVMGRPVSWRGIEAKYTSTVAKPRRTHDAYEDTFRRLLTEIQKGNGSVSSFGIFYNWPNSLCFERRTDAVARQYAAALHISLPARTKDSISSYRRYEAACQLIQYLI